jgi:hypothetical protein
LLLFRFFFSGEGAEFSQEIVILTWRSNSAMPFYQELAKRPMDQKAIVAYKALHTIHKLLQEGPPKVCSIFLLIQNERATFVPCVPLVDEFCIHIAIDLSFLWQRCLFLLEFPLMAY